MDVLGRLDETRASINVLEHPFYQRWGAGELSEAELVCYAQEYRHVVGALARTSTLAADECTGEHAAELRRHAEQERAHITLWEQFAREAGAPPRARFRKDAQEDTAACVRDWTAGDDLLEHLAVLYVIEASQPEVSQTKVDGLTTHYGYAMDGPAVEYFKLHEDEDQEHARLLAGLIGELLADLEDPGAAGDRMVGRAREALCANWRLLDGVEAVTGGAKSRVSV